jgi:mono/diheme cytochrome c family protein
MRFLSLAWVALIALLVAVGCHDANDRSAGATANERGQVTPVRGPSVLSKFGLSVAVTRFGQLGGTAPAGATSRQEPMPDLSAGRGAGGGMFAGFFHRRQAVTAGQPFVLTGADLYRLSCRSCHGPDGNGAPPEINSLLEPVQGTSAALLTERMRKGSHPVDPSFLQTVAAGAEQDLRQRLREGGKRMPSFAHLSESDADALIGHLQRMVGIPEAARPERRLTLAAARVGELVVKGTCHICHDATGPGRHLMMMQEAIPSLASMPQGESLEQLIAKVRQGVAPTMMMRTGPSQMPELPYLTAQELAAAMLYVREYSPQR